MPHRPDPEEIPMTALNLAPSEHLMPSIHDIRIATPCHASWSDMSGDEKVRHCRLCRKNVYNISAMTEAEAVALIVETEGDFCGRIYRRADGSILTADCPVGLAERAYRRAHRIFLSLCALIGGLVLGGTTLFGGSAKTDCPSGSEPVMQMGEVEAISDPQPSRAATRNVESERGAGLRVEMGDVAFVPKDRPARLGRIALPRPAR